jgi:hypothetical protein
MHQADLCVADEQFLPRICHLSIGIKKLDGEEAYGCSSSAVTDCDSSCGSSSSSTDSYCVNDEGLDIVSIVPLEIDPSLDCDDLPIIHDCSTIPHRSKPDSYALRRRFAAKFPEIEQERIAIILRQKEQEEERTKERDGIKLERLRNTMTERLELMKQTTSELEARQFCSDHGFAGVNAKRKKINGCKYALHSAVKRRDAHMIEALIRAGADPTFRNSRQQTPLQLAQAMHEVRKNDMTAVISALSQCFDSGLVDVGPTHSQTISPFFAP